MSALLYAMHARQSTAQGHPRNVHTHAPFPRFPTPHERRAAVRLSACRGKLLAEEPPRALGPLSNWTVPQRWFGHFYALGSACNVAVAYLLLGSPFYASLAPRQQATAALALALLQLHLGRRLAETAGLMRYPPGSRMHGIAYLFGMRWAGGTTWLMQQPKLPDSPVRRSRCLLSAHCWP